MYSRASQLIGEGTFSEVYQAMSLDGRGDYAWKQLKSDADVSDAERFRREVEILADLQHANIVEIVFTDLLAPQPYFVMPRARQNLETAIKFDVSRQLDLGRIFKEICEAVIFAHDNGVLHRDLNPRNILLTFDGTIKVADFGLARNLFFHQAGLTKINETGGTRPYAAPEQLDGSLKKATARADIYSLGKILYYIYTRRVPHHIDSSSRFLPKEVYEIVRRATDLDIARRYEDVGAMLNEFMLFDFGVSLPAVLPHKVPLKKKYVEVQLEAQKLAISTKGGGVANNRKVEQVAFELQKIMWLNRGLLWGNAHTDNPLDILDPTVAFDLLGFQIDRPDTLGAFSDNSGDYEVAGEINQLSRVVSISSRFDHHIARFTEAHELGHALLHKQEVLHRDRPINSSNSERATPPEEREANKFAACFLMPEKQVLKEFRNIFGGDRLEINRQMAEDLIRNDVATLMSLAGDGRGLAKFIASVDQIGTRRVTPLDELFGVSNEAMAIRLEELGIVRFPSE